MDWPILILGVPAILIPLVLLFGFAGCTPAAEACSEESDCPAGTACSQGACVPLAEVPPPPLAPENLAAIALDDHSVSLTWTDADPTATDFQIERAPENGDFAAIPAPADLSPTGATDASGLQAGVTFLYRVRALLGQEPSEPSDIRSATVFPAAPVNLVATPVNIDQIDLSWDNASAIATDYILEHRVPGGTFAEIFRGAGTTFSHSNDPSLVEGTRHEYRVFAIVVDGFENDVAQDVKSAASVIASATTLAFTAAFTAPPGTLTTDAAGLEGFCVVQRLSQTLLAAGGTQVRILLRGSTTGSLTLDKVAISQVAATGDPYDAAPDLTEVASGVTIAPNTAVTVGPVNYTLDPTLLVAFDISNTPGEGNLRFGGLTGADTYSKLATAEAGVQDRTTGYPNFAADNLALIEIIQVL
jgi:hypothetical protein